MGGNPCYALEPVSHINDRVQRGHWICPCACEPASPHKSIHRLCTTSQTWHGSELLPNLNMPHNQSGTKYDVADSVDGFSGIHFLAPRSSLKDTYLSHYLKLDSSPCYERCIPYYDTSPSELSCRLVPGPACAASAPLKSRANPLLPSCATA